MDYLVDKNPFYSGIIVIKNKNLKVYLEDLLFLNKIKTITLIKIIAKMYHYSIIIPIKITKGMKVDYLMDKNLYLETILNN